MEVKPVRVGRERLIGPSGESLIVAEIGQNHNGQPALAEQLVDAASWAGADAVKLIKRDLDGELSRTARQRPYHGPHAFGATYEQHRQALELTQDCHARLARRARQRGLLYIMTVGDEAALDFAEKLDADALKIASRDCSNLPLIERVAARRRPVLLSTGMSDFDEIDRAAEVLKHRNCKFVVMQCTSLYPAPARDAHLRSLSTMADRYRVPVGYSDHTTGPLLGPVAVAMGAAVLEKHLTLDRSLRGTDHACSLEPEEFFGLVEQVRRVESALGSAEKPVPEAIRETKAKLGRSVVARKRLTRGTPLDPSMVSLKCPGSGMSWHQFASVVGRPLRRDIAADEMLAVEDFD